MFTRPPYDGDMVGGYYYKVSILKRFFIIWEKFGGKCSPLRLSACSLFAMESFHFFPIFHPYFISCSIKFDLSLLLFAWCFPDMVFYRWNQKWRVVLHDRTATCGTTFWISKIEFFCVSRIKFFDKNVFVYIALFFFLRVLGEISFESLKLGKFYKVGFLALETKFICICRVLLSSRNSIGAEN